jgi:hypothetical protein
MAGEDNCSAAERSIIRRAAVLTTELEPLEVKVALAGEASAHNLDLFSRAAANLRASMRTATPPSRSICRNSSRYDIVPACPTEKLGLQASRYDFQQSGYGGPCPPRGHGMHHYHFRLLALSVDRLSISPRPSCREVEREARKYSIAEATLVGVYQR